MKKRVFFAALALFSFAAFFSCSNAAGGSDSESSKPSSASASKKPGYVTLTGTVSVSGAVPKILSDNYDSSSDNDGVSRSAQPGINTSGDGATMEYFARATSGDLVSEGAFGTGADAKKFGLELQAEIEWTIEVGVREKSTSKLIPERTVYLSSTWKVTPDPAAPTISHNFVPVPNTSGGTGSIALKIKYDPNSYTITPKFVDGPDGFADLNSVNWTKLEKSDGWIFQLSGVKSGKYELCLDFKVKSTNEIVYSTIQSVTVANGMQTDSWVADSSSSAVSPISASGEFNFNSNASTLMAAFLGTNLFVGKVSDDCDAPADTNSGNYLSPLATVTAAVEKIASFGNKDSDYFVRVSGTVGAMGSRLPADIESISKSSNAKSLTIIGTSGSNADCIKTASAANPAVKVSTDVPVTFKNIKIMGVSGGMGSGMAISAFGGSNVTIDEGCLITGGKVGVGVTGDSTKVTMKGGSFSGNGADVYLESGKVLTVDGNLSNVADKGIVVSLQSWTRGTQFIESGEHLSAITEDIVKKFDFTKTGWDTPIYDSDKKAKIDADIYVAASGKDSETVDGITVENTIGNKNYPFASIKQASKYLDASHGTIYVSGSVSGAQEIPASVASTCTAIKLTGLAALPTSGTNAYVPSDEINAGGAVGAGTALTVATSVPVTIENLKITGGRSGTSYTGGGVTINAGSVTLSDGAWVSGNLANGNVNCGGGVYVKSEAKLFMRGKSLVGDKSAATNESGANNLEIGEGGGICNEGSVYIGCNESGVAATGYALDDGYGVRGNWSNQYGGGIANLGTLIIASGEISYNATDYNAYSEGWGAVSTPGGGVYNKSGSLTINGGKIYANKSTDGGGIYLEGGSAVMNGGTIGGDTTDMGNVAAGKGLSSGGGLVINTSCEFKMLGGTISHNSAKNFGGAVSASGTFTMSGGIISENEVNGLGDVHGGAVYVYGTFNLNGSAYIPSGVKNNSGVLVSGAGKNDVYLYNDRTVTVTGALSPKTSTGSTASLSVGALALSSWSRGTKFLSSTSTNASSLVAAKSKIALSKDPTGWDKSDDATTSSADTRYAWITSPIYVASSGDSDSTRIVCSKAPTSGNNGTKTSPYATISAALADTDLAYVSNTITIDGTLSAQTIPSGVTLLTGVTAVTLQGYKASGAATSAAVINGGGTAHALAINKSATYTIKDLQITNGSYDYGGGIYLIDGTVNLDSGAKVFNNKAKANGTGAGVYVANGATLNINNGAEVYSNFAVSGNINGGGVYNLGTVNIYSGSKLYKNTANYGGAIYNKGTLSMSGGTIGGSAANANTAAWGGGIYNDTSKSLAISGGELSYNSATNSAALGNAYGGAIMNYGSLTISGAATISNNTASETNASQGYAYGGGIYNATSGSIEITGAITMNANNATVAATTSGQSTSQGGAIYNAGSLTMSKGTIGASGKLNTVTGKPVTVKQGGAIYQGGTFNISGAAYVYTGTEASNDVCLASGKTITVADTLSTSGNVATLTLANWSRGTNFLSSTSANATKMANSKDKFALSKDPTGWTKSDDSTTSSAATRYAWITSPIYVASSGTIDTTRKVCSAAPTSGNNGTKTSPYATIAAALADTDLSKVENTITIDGTLSAQSVANTVTLPSGVTAVTLQGYKAEDDTTSAATINGGGTASALSISKSATYTIKDLKITNGKTTSGGGIYLGAGTVNLDSGAKVYNNKVTSSGAGVYVVNGASLNIKSGSEIYSNSAYSGYINGGGVCNLGTVDMTGGSIYSNSANNGGGIYSSGTLYVRGSALIGNKTETTATGSTAGTYCSNSAIASGGGIYNSGTLYFGCNTSGTKDADSGYALDSGYGVRRNYANDGGGIYNTGTFKSGSGSISYNYAPNSAGGLYAGGSTNNMGGLGVSYNNTGKNGAGVYVASSKSAEVTAQSGVNHNTATASSGSSDVCGGGIYVAGTLTTTAALNANWNSASITGGSGKAYGGCVYIASGGKFVYSKGQLGGTSQSNTVSNTVSGSTDKAYGGSVYQGGTFEVSANGYIPKGSLRSDDVYLPSEKYITVTDVISGNSESSQMTITPATWKRGTQVLAKGGDLSYTNFKNQIVKFKGSETDWLAVYNSYVGKLYTSYKIYVSQSGYDDDKNGLGTSAKPYKTISKAVGECWTTGSDFTVYVSGTIKGAHTIGGTDVTINAKSLTLEGTGTSPTIDAEKADNTRPLTINTSLGVTIKNLTITKGKFTGYGGGIRVEGGCTLTLDDGASVLSNYASSGGGGVFVASSSTTLIMKSGSVINKNVGSEGGGVRNLGKVLMSGTARIGATGTSKPSTSDSTPTGNYSGIKGGGIYNAGTVCLGYTAWTNETENTPKKLEGGITQNYGRNISGGIYVDTGAKVYMKTGNISYNMGGTGGGMTIASGTVKLLGGLVESNWSDNTTPKGGAIFDNGTLYLGGSVYIPYGGSVGNNDLYLSDKSVSLNTDIAPPEDCTTGVIATIYPATYSGICVVASNTAYASCLAVVPQSSQAWTINTSNGYLKTANAITSSNISSVVSGLSSGTTKEFVADSTFDNDSLAALKTQLNALSSDNTAKIKLDLSQSSVTSIWETGIITSRVTSLKIPNKLKSGIWQGLWNATGLTEILVSPANTYYCSESGILYRHDAEGNKIALTIYPAAKTGSTYTLPTTVTYLDGACFLNNQNLTTISGLTQIKGFSTYGHQFNGCQKLTSTIDLRSATDNTVLDHTTIGYCPKITTVWLPNTITKICNYNFYSCPELTAVHFKSTVPPTLEVSSGKIFYNVNSNLKVYVPTNAAKTSYANSDDFRDSSKNALISGGSASGWTSRLYVD